MVHLYCRLASATCSHHGLTVVGVSHITSCKYSGQVGLGDVALWNLLDVHSSVEREDARLHARREMASVGVVRDHESVGLLLGDAEEEAFARMRMDERIGALKDYLPKTLVEIKQIYGIYQTKFKKITIIYFA